LLDDYLYGRGVYGNGFSSMDPVAFRIPKASEALYVWIFHALLAFSALMFSPWSISENYVCSFRDWTTATQRAIRKRDSVWRPQKLPR